MHTFKIVSINTSKNKGERKKAISQAVLLENHGIEDDAHADNWHRQISLLANEDIKEMQKKGVDVSYGDFAENITTEGIELASLPIGTRLYIDNNIKDNVVLEITQIGKECHSKCNIYHQAGYCIMPIRGVFAKVLKGGSINTNSIGHYN